MQISVIKPIFGCLAQNLLSQKIKYKTKKIKYKAQIFEPCTLFFALYFIFLPCTLSILILQDGNGDPRIASTPTLCFSTSGMHRARVKSYRQIASAKRFQVSSYFHFATLKGKVPTQDCHVLKACTRNLGRSWHGRCSWSQFPTGPPKNGATIKALTT